jgi:hypothetical protein
VVDAGQLERRRSSVRSPEVAHLIPVGNFSERTQIEAVCRYALAERERSEETAGQLLVPARISLPMTRTAALPGRDTRGDETVVAGSSTADSSANECHPAIDFDVPRAGYVPPRRVG